MTAPGSSFWDFLGMPIFWLAFGSTEMWDKHGQGLAKTGGLVMTFQRSRFSILILHLPRQVSRYLEGPTGGRRFRRR